MYGEHDSKSKKGKGKKKGKLAKKADGKKMPFWLKFKKADTDKDKK